MDLIGKTLGNRYEIIEKIGNGGMAGVYKAKDKTLNRNVAIKVLKEEFASDQEFVKRFQIEAQSAASLSHPNIVSIYDVSNDGDINYIVMELIVGKTLKEVIKENGKLDWRKSVEIASQIASGLSTAHKNHIIHRDIKPHNIVIAKDSLVKITDFGIAKATTASTINANANSMGSVHYFSPEHARGGYTDEKSDIYSLGVVLYEMVTGKLPFDGDTPIAVAMKHIKDDPTPPIKIIPEIPQGLNDIILKAMQKESSSRYLNAHEMYIDLQKLLRDPAVKNVGITRDDQEIFATQKIPNVHITKSPTYAKETTKEGAPTNNKTKSKKAKSPLVKPLKGILIKIILLILVFVGAALGGFLIINGGFDGPVERAEVPDVIGNSKDAAKVKLENAGFVMEVVGEVADNMPKDYVVKQKSIGGTMEAKGTKIEITLSSGPKKVIVPDVLSDSLTAASMKIRNADLQINVIEEASEDVPEDRVIRQSPLPNSQAYANDEVTVYVSKGLPDDVTVVPDVLAETEEAANEKLKELGFVVVPSYTKDLTRDNGKILHQTPNGGSKAPTGSSVILVINKTVEDEPKEPTLVTVAPVISKPEDNQPETTSTPTSPQPSTPPAPVANKMLTINLANKSIKGFFQVKVELNGDIKGRTHIYEGNHQASEKSIQVPYPEDATGVLRVYIDGVLDSEQVL